LPDGHFCRSADAIRFWGLIAASKGFMFFSSDDVEWQVLINKEQLDQMSVDILRFIQSRAINGMITSYKDVKKHFKITYPTTQTKLEKLPCIIELPSKSEELPEKVLRDVQQWVSP